MPKYEVTGYFIEESYERYTIKVEADNAEQAVYNAFHHGDGDDFHHSKCLHVIGNKPVNVEDWEAKET